MSTEKSFSLLSIYSSSITNTLYFSDSLSVSHPHPSVRERAFVFPGKYLESLNKSLFHHLELPHQPGKPLLSRNPTDIVQFGTSYASDNIICFSSELFIFYIL